MKKLRWQLVIILLTGLVVGVLLITQQPQVSQTSTPVPTKGGIYAEALIGDFKRLNPLLDLYNPPDRDVDRLIFSSLVRFDNRGLPQPDLAENWGVSEDGTLYNISLRQATWHDGSPVTADDVLFTIDLMRSDNTVIPEDLRNFWKDVDVKVLDPHYIQFALPEPFAPFMDFLTFGILPGHLLQGISMDDLANDTFNMNPVGSGPFRFNHLAVENEQVTGVVLDAYSGYYGAKPFIEQIIFNYYPDGESALAGYQSGDVQGISRVNSDILPQVLAEPGLSVYTGRQSRLSMVYFNLKNDDVPFFQVVELRKALLMGLNRQWMLDNILSGQAVMADGPILPGTWAYYNDTKGVSFDLDGAKKLLDSAGFKLGAETQKLEKDGKAVAFTLIFPDDTAHQAMADAIQSNWAELGVDVTLEPLPYDTLINERLSNRDYQAALVEINLSQSYDPDPYPFWDQAQVTNGQNYAQWDNRAASEYLEQARLTVDPTERTRLYRNFQVLFAKEMPSLPLFYPVYTYAVSSSVQGIQMGPIFEPNDRFSNVSAWFLESSAGGAQSPAATATP